MGWCGGTEYFDGMVDIFMKYADPTEDEVKDFVAELYDHPLFQHSDWDCESESKYWEPYLLEHMHNTGQIDDEDYRAYTDPDY